MRPTCPTSVGQWVASEPHGCPMPQMGTCAGTTVQADALHWLATVRHGARRRAVENPRPRPHKQKWAPPPEG